MAILASRFCKVALAALGTLAALAVLGLAGCSPAPPEEGAKPKPKVEPTGPHASLLRLFPNVGDVSDWKAQGDARVYGPVANPAEGVEAVEADLPAGAATLKGYGYAKSATRKYARGQAETVTLRVFEMKVPQDAFGVFSVSASGTTFPNIGLAARMSTNTLWLVKGSYVATVDYSGTMDPTPVLMDFGRWVADQVSSAGYRPAILDNFPLKSLEGERYYLHAFATLAMLPFVPRGDAQAMARALALSPDTEMAVMGYQSSRPGAPNYLFLVRYPTEADAQAAYKMYVESYLAQSTYPPEQNIAVAPPVQSYLAGTFNAEENSLSDQLAKLLAALGG
ncbi:MAG: hypothetical protein FJ288_20225 [Planctomycetes bacterium]|nr:hypothetical protein [Planctomycetota bacterium]